jgi:actin-related protein
MEENDTSVVVIDNGSSMIKAGFAGLESPHFVEPTAVSEDSL